jgi:hypothetical protein
MVRVPLIKVCGDSQERMGEMNSMVYALASYDGIVLSSHTVCYALLASSDLFNNKCYSFSNTSHNNIDTFQTK